MVHSSATEGLSAAVMGNCDSESSAIISHDETKRHNDQDDNVQHVLLQN